MNKINFDDLPVLESFKNLKKGDAVYSKKYGLGCVYSFYDKYDEVIFEFSHGKHRFSVEEADICKVPDKYLEKISRPKVKVIVDGVSMSFAEFKKRRRWKIHRKKLLEMVRKNCHPQKRKKKEHEEKQSVLDFK